MVKGMMNVLEVAFVSILLVIVIVTLGIAPRQKNADYMPMMKEKAMRVLEYLDYSGMLQELSCKNSTKDLENEMEKYVDFMFDASFCIGGNCTVYQTPPYGDVGVVRYPEVNCNKTVVDIYVYVWR